jgi:hypothetical protein
VAGVTVDELCMVSEALRLLLLLGRIRGRDELM